MLKISFIKIAKFLRINVPMVVIFKKKCVLEFRITKFKNSLILKKVLK